MEDCSKLISEYKRAFRRTNNGNVNVMYKVASNLYDAMVLHYDYCVEKGDIKQQFRICELIDQEVLPKLANAIINTKSERLANNVFELNKKFFALSARRVLKNFALYIEQYKTKKVWAKTMDTMECIFKYCDEFSISDDLNLLRFSCMPGLGKSYTANLFVAQTVGNDANATMLRITYSDDLVESTTNQTKSIIQSEAYAEIFPRYKGLKNVFKKATNSSFILIDCEDDTQFYAVTRDGQASGKRAKYVIIDDLLKGEIESNNVTLHNQLTQRYYSDWGSRADDDKQKTILLGTMWADTDLLNVMYDKANAKGLDRDPDYPCVEVAKDRSGAFIRIPALDINDESTCPLRFSTKHLKEKRDNMTQYLWMAVYQQDPIAPDGLEFNYSVLNTYQKDEKPTIEESEGRYASLDPARRGKNYVSMPICYKKGDRHYPVDWIYQKKDMKELYDVIVDKIIEHRISRLLIENNTDTSLKEVIETKLKQKNYLFCTITEKYSTKNKEIRIKDSQSTIRNYICFPAKGVFHPNHDVSRAMESLTSFSFSYPNKFDDAIDSCGLYADEFIDNAFEFPEVGTFERW